MEGHRSGQRIRKCTLSHHSGPTACARSQKVSHDHHTYVPTAMPCHAMPCHAKLHLNHCTSLPRFITTSLTNEQTGRLPDTCMLTRPQPSSRHSGSEFVCMHAHMVLQRSRHNTTASELTDSSFSSCASRTYPHASRSRIMHCLLFPHACLSLPRTTSCVSIACVSLTSSRNCIRGSHDLTNLHACVSQPHLTLCVSRCPT
jgi:hypothetical protein